MLGSSRTAELSGWWNTGITATGGTISTITDGGTTYTLHTFTTIGNNAFTVTRGSGNIEILMVGGGAGGGQGLNFDFPGGGGGAGGYYLVSNAAVSTQSYNVVVGNGSIGGTANVGANFGGESSFGVGNAVTTAAIYRSYGGSPGGGTTYSNPGGPPTPPGYVIDQNGGSTGGSGGGSSSQNGLVPPVVGGTAAVPDSYYNGDGNDGGDGDNETASPFYRFGGGGGGASTAANARTAGTGITSTFSGTSTLYAVGGDGGTDSRRDPVVPPTNAAYGSGGGGGTGNVAGVASSNPGGNGRQGIVLIRYPVY